MHNAFCVLQTWKRSFPSDAGLQGSRRSFDSSDSRHAPVTYELRAARDTAYAARATSFGVQRARMTFQPLRARQASRTMSTTSVGSILLLVAFEPVRRQPFGEREALGLTG